MWLLQKDLIQEPLSWTDAGKCGCPGIMGPREWVCLPRERLSNWDSIGATSCQVQP